MPSASRLSAGPAAPSPANQAYDPAAITDNWPSLPGHSDDLNLRERPIQDAQAWARIRSPEDHTCALA
jgi:hypothetical protein